MGKMFAAFLLAWAIFFATILVYSVSAEETPAFNMCACLEKAKDFYNLEGKEARTMCHEALIYHLMEKSKSSGKIETAAILGCEDKE